MPILQNQNQNQQTRKHEDRILLLSIGLKVHPGIIVRLEIKDKQTLRCCANMRMPPNPPISHERSQMKIVLSTACCEY